MSSLPDVKVESKTLNSRQYKAACDDVLLARAKNSKKRRSIEFRDGSSLSFLMGLAKK